MTIDEVVQRLATRVAGSPAAVVRIETSPLRGGISANHVSAVTIRWVDAAERRCSLRLVVKRLVGPARREAAVHRRVERGRLALAPHLVAVERRAGITTLVLERIDAVERWPWRQMAHAEDVLRVAAKLHAADVGFVPAWSYEQDLRRSADATLVALVAARRGRSLPIDAASLRAVGRIVGAVDAVRRELLLRGPFPRSLIHGDLHTGNVILSNRAGIAVPVLLDWGRARIGSPLEDVASWIHSLGCWEPEARTRHDSLLAAYVRARGCASITATAREGCWLAGASNALAGALLHHVDVATSPWEPRGARAASAWAVRDWLRIIRRAAAVWADPRCSRPGVGGRRTRG